MIAIYLLVHYLNMVILMIALIILVVYQIIKRDTYHFLKIFNLMNIAQKSGETKPVMYEI